MREEAFQKYDPPKVDDNGTIIYGSLDEFLSFPISLQRKCLNQSRIKLFIKKDEDAELMKDLMGGEQDLADFLYKRDVDDLMNKHRVTNKK